MGTVELIRLKIMVVPYTLRKSAPCPLLLKRKKKKCVHLYIKKNGWITLAKDISRT